MPIRGYKTLSDDLILTITQVHSVKIRVTVIMTRIKAFKKPADRIGKGIAGDIIENEPAGSVSHIQQARHNALPRSGCVVNSWRV